ARVFKNIKSAQTELDEWVHHYNNERPHQGIEDEVPASRFIITTPRPTVGTAAAVATGSERVAKPGQVWVSRKVGANGVVCVDWQQVSVGLHYAGERCDVLVAEELFQF